jgi:RHS repeat-associated protein
MLVSIPTLKLANLGGSTTTTQSTLSYDNNGNLITDGTYTYTWNARNQLQTVSNTTGGTILANYSYDASGRRTSKAILSGTTTTTTGFTYDGANFVQELNKAGTNTSPNTTNDIRATLITAGVDEALARMTGSGAAAQVLSLATDGNNNTLHTSDQAQTQNTAYTYEAYGRATSTNSTDTNSQQYTGRELDIKSAGTAPTNNNPLNSGGLMYYRARYYLPGCARFISEDPIGWASGQTNGYAYVGGSPLSYRDSRGLAAGGAQNNVGNCVYSVGVTGGFNLPIIGPIGIASTWSVGVVWDSHGGWGVYGTTPDGVVGGAGVGAGVSVGVSASVFGGNSIGDYAGPFQNSSVGAGLGPYGSYDVFRDPSKNISDPSGYGAGVTVGVGVGGSGSVTQTNATVIPIGTPSGNSGGQGSGGGSGSGGCF